MHQPIRLLIVDDHPLARQGLITMLHAFEDRFHVLGEAGSHVDAMAQFAIAKPDVVISDLHFDRDKSRTGIELAVDLMALDKAVKVLILTSDLFTINLLRAHDAGVHGYLNKDASAAEIARAIESVASGFTHFPVALKLLLDEREARPQLTPREASLLPHIASGLTAKEIARKITKVDPENPLTDRTVEVHKGNIKRKFALHSPNALITYAIEHCQENRIDYKK